MYMYVCICIYVYMNACVCVYVCMYMYFYVCTCSTQRGQENLEKTFRKARKGVLIRTVIIIHKIFISV